jgi:tetratricopeptide (TPR) repeat protein
MARLALSQTEFRLGDVKTALEQLDEYLKIYPDDFSTLNAKAWVLATCEDEKFRDGKKALELAKKVHDAQQTNGIAACETLAAAYAELGDFDEAVKWMEKSLQLAPPLLKEGAQKRVDLFKSKQPVRIPVPNGESKPDEKEKSD